MKQSKYYVLTDGLIPLMQLYSTTVYKYTINTKRIRKCVKTH